MHRRRLDRRGFTLLETVAALAIVALVAVSALAAVAQQLNVASRARMIARAEELAAERYAVLRVLPTAAQRALPDSMVAGRFPYPDNGYTWRMTESQVLNELDVYDVQIAVDWAGGSYTVSTRVYAPVADTTS